MDVREKIALLPHQPGVYRYYDSEGTVIYVGKAKDLAKRVAQYFVDPERLNTKTRILVSKIADLQYSVVDSEADALLLENNLIKQYKPRYNILLKDSKTYPWICVTSEPYPRVYLTRRVEQNGSRYFGPYSSVMHARTLLEFFERNYPLRSCKHKIDSQAILHHKYRPCLDMHLGRCRGCCVGAVSQEDYKAWTDEIVRLLSGGVNDIIRQYKAGMQQAADALNFELAQEYKNRIEALQKHYAKSIITSAGDRDEFDGQEAFGNFLRIRGGAIIQSLNLGFRMNIEESEAAVLSTFIGEIESKFGELGREVIVPFLPDVQMDGVEFRIPQRGDKLALLELSSKNAKEFRFNSLKQREHTNPDEFRAAVLEELRSALGMKELPVHMECFDNSNIQGTNPVASCVVFRNAKPSKKEYRHFNIKTVEGSDDFASMREVITRRYSRLVQEGQELPQLLIVDGGKGQVTSALEALGQIGLHGDITVVGIAKRLNEVYFPGDSVPMYIDKNSETLHVIQRLRDEAHRFAITFHRKQRSKGQVRSALDEIPGIGPKTRTVLLKHFKSLKRIREASQDELSAVIGPAKARVLCEALAPPATS